MIRLLIAGITLSVAFVAHADSDRPVAYQRSAGAWSIAGDPEAGGCVARRPGESGVHLVVAILPQKETMRFIISSPAWKSLGDGDIRLTGIFFAKGHKVTDVWSLDAVSASEESNGPKIYFDILKAKNDGADFVKQFRTAVSIGFARDSIPIGSIHLDGSAGAIDALLECRDVLRSDSSFDPFKGN